MDLIRNILIDQKFYTSLEEVDKYLQDVDAQEGSVVQTLIFDKEVFETQAEAIEWATSHGFTIQKEVDDTEGSFHIRQLDPTEFIETSFRTIELRRGVSAVIGILKQEASSDSMHLSLRNIDGIQLSASVPHIIEIAKVIEGFHNSFGQISITKEILKSFVNNFNDNVVGVELMIDFDHETKEAAGWLKSLFLDFDEATLLGEVRWTPKGALALSDREFRYFSPEFTLNYIHPHTGIEHGPTLLGGALVNRPFLKMDAIVSLKNEGEVQMKDMISLKDHEDKVAELTLKIEEFKLGETKVKEVIDGLKSENLKLSEEIKGMKEAETKKLFIEKIEKLFSENKINKAQLQALKEGKDAMEVLTLGGEMHTEANGSNASNEAVALTEEEVAFCSRLGLTKEEYLKYNK